MSAAFAAAASSSRFAPSSVGWRRLMMDAKPNFLISGTAVDLMAPEQATVVSRRWKFVMPSTFSLVTSCALDGAAANSAVAINPAAIRKLEFMSDSLPSQTHYVTNPAQKPEARGTGRPPREPAAQKTSNKETERKTCGEITQRKARKTN